jgi:hypothetical protein
VLDVATCNAPKFLSIHIFPVGLVTFTTAVAPAQLTVPAVKVPIAGLTVIFKVHVCPPMFIAKLAVPLALGVPLIVYTNAPAPVASEPAAILAVKPVTSVDAIVWAA